MQIEYLQSLAPEIIVCVFGLLCLGAGMARGPSGPAWGKGFALAGLLIASLLVGYQGAYRGAAPDAFLGYVRLLTLSVGVLVVLVSWALPAPGRVPEMFALMLFSILGMMLVAGSDDLVLLFFALELVSVPTYVMVAAGAQTSAAQEAGLKYFFLGAMTSAMTVYGFSFLYGVAGTTAMFSDGPAGANIGAALSRGFAENPAAWLGLVLAILGLAYKVAAVPMHFYVADVYQGAAAPVSGFLSFVPKFAGLVAMIKVLSLVGWPLAPGLYWLIWLMAVATMTAGNTLALLQDNVKRMLAYSSVAHSGYMLVGLLVGPAIVEGFNPVQDGVAAVLFYIVAYGIMNIGAFAVIGYLAEGGREPQLIQSLGGLGRARAGVGVALALCVFGLLGAPPTIGFFGKVFVFGSAMSLAGHSGSAAATIVLVVIALINTAVSAGYYLRIVGAAYLRPAEPDGWRTTAWPVGLGLAACAVLVIVLGLHAGWLAGPAMRASRDMEAIERAPAVPPAMPVRVWTGLEPADVSLGAGATGMQLASGRPVG